LEDHLTTLEVAYRIVDVIDEHKGENITLLDFRPDGVMADFVVIATGNSDRQLRALADYVRTGVKEGYEALPFSVDGTPQSGWVLMDYGDILVNLFDEETRSYYDLENLWHDRSKVLVTIQ
jgi:ribosome-associated protein